MLILPPQVIDARQDTIAMNCAGDRIVVGSPYDSTMGDGAGAAFLFDDSGNLLRIFRQPDPSPNDHFGSAVAMNCDGNKILIGAHGVENIKRSPPDGHYPEPGQHSGSTKFPGAAYLFNQSGCILQTYYNPDTLDDIDTSKVSNFNGVGDMKDDGYGKAVAMNQKGDRIIIASPSRNAVRDGGIGNDNIAGGAVRVNAGVVFVYDEMGKLISQLHAPTPNYDNEFFGRDIAINSDASQILVGSPIRHMVYLFNDRGEVQTEFTLSEEDEQQQLQEQEVVSKPTRGKVRTFGFSVTMDGDASVIVIGAPSGADQQNDPHGIVYLYNNRGTLMQQIASPNPQSGDAFGTSVSITNNANTIFIGSPYRDNFGAAYRYDRNGNEQSFIYSDNSGNADRNNSLGFGWTVTQNTHGTRGVIGAWWSPGITLLCFNPDSESSETVIACPTNDRPTDIPPLDFVCDGIAQSSYLSKSTKADLVFCLALLGVSVMIASFVYIYWFKFHHSVPSAVVRRRLRDGPEDGMEMVRCERESQQDLDQVQRQQQLMEESDKNN